MRPVPGQVEKLPADAAASVRGVDKKGEEEPALTAYERGREADDTTVFLGDERALTVVGKQVPM